LTLQPSVELRLDASNPSAQVQVQMPGLSDVSMVSAVLLELAALIGLAVLSLALALPVLFSRSVSVVLIAQGLSNP